MGIETGISSAKLSQPRVRVSRQKAVVVDVGWNVLKNGMKNAFVLAFIKIIVVEDLIHTVVVEVII